MFALDPLFPADAAPLRTRVLGVDFSGGALAGRKIWIASGSLGHGVLKIDRVCRAEDLPGSAAQRAPALAALVAHLATQTDAAIGLDFPVSLPAALLGDHPTWEEFLSRFAERFPDERKFRAICFSATGGRELKRRCDIEQKTPMSAYNLRLFRQTYHGIRGVLAPLVLTRRACALPMQPADPDRPWLLETCPASLLKRVGDGALYRTPYKGATRSASRARGVIVRSFEACGALALDRPALRSTLTRDREGDALDSVLAALGVATALFDEAGLRPRDALDAREGRVYA